MPSDAPERVALREDMRNIVDYMKQSGYLGQNEDGYSNVARPGEKDCYLPEEGLDHFMPEFWFGGGKAVHRTFIAGRWIYQRLTDPKFQIDHSKNRLPDNQNQLMHIFRDKKDGGGHLYPNNTINRELLETTSRTKSNYLGCCQNNGHHWYHKLLNDGRQLWVEVRNGIIVNGGINNVAKSFNPISGLKARIAPIGRK